MREVGGAREVCEACVTREAGPVAAMNWAFSSEAGNPPNIIFFIAALLGLLK